jgi:hypothetical protein
MNLMPLLTLMTFVSCSNPFQNPIKADGNLKPGQTGFICRYQQQKENGKNAQHIYPITDRREYIKSLIVDSLIPCWYGTAWDFNGTTEIPGTGKIACGYFVTTVIRDAGLPIERIKMAQCPSETMITALCYGYTIKRFSNKPIDVFIDSIKGMGEGIYIIGLDYHTGFIYNDGKQVYFIHASYASSKCVLKEPAASSSILYHSKYKIIGKLKI